MTFDARENLPEDNRPTMEELVERFGEPTSSTWREDIPRRGLFLSDLPSAEWIEYVRELEGTKDGARVMLGAAERFREAGMRDEAYKEQYLDFLVHLYRTSSDHERYGIMIRLQDYGFEMPAFYGILSPDEFATQIQTLAKVCIGE